MPLTVDTPSSELPRTRCKVASFILTGILNLLRITDWAARGFAIGTASHGIGTSDALQVNEVAGAFSELAIGLNAIAAALLLPLLWKLL